MSREGSEGLSDRENPTIPHGGENRPHSDREESDAQHRGFPIPDRSLLEGVRRRDPDALGSFFEFYFDRIYAIAYRMLGDRVAAQDVTQDVFCKVHGAAGRLDASRDPGPWLTTITMNLCRSIWRSSAYRMARQATPIGPDEKAGYEIASSEPDPATQHLDRERDRIVQDAVLQLDETARAVVVLHDYQGLDHREIASILGLSHDAARKRHSRALQELGRLLEGRLR